MQKKNDERKKKEKGKGKNIPGPLPFQPATSKRKAALRNGGENFERNNFVEKAVH